MPAFHVCAGWSLGCFTQELALWYYTWGSSKRQPNCLSPCHPHRTPIWSSRLLVWSWPRPGHCSQSSRLKINLSLSLSLHPSLLILCLHFFCNSVFKINKINLLYKNHSSKASVEAGRRNEVSEERTREDSFAYMHMST